MINWSVLEFLLFFVVNPALSRAVYAIDQGNQTNEAAKACPEYYQVSHVSVEAVECIPIWRIRPRTLIRILPREALVVIVLIRPIVLALQDISFWILKSCTDSWLYRVVAGVEVSVVF